MEKKFESDYQLTDAGYYILLALLEPKHGYGIMKYIDNLTEGEFILGPATLYTTLKKMQKNQFIIQIAENDDRKKNYELTHLGEEVILGEIKRRMRMANQGQYVLNSIKKGN